MNAPPRTKANYRYLLTLYQARTQTANMEHGRHESKDGKSRNADAKTGLKKSETRETRHKGDQDKFTHIYQTSMGKVCGKETTANHKVNVAAAYAKVPQPRAAKVVMPRGELTKLRSSFAGVEGRCTRQTRNIMPTKTTIKEKPNPPMISACLPKASGYKYRNLGSLLQQCHSMKK